MTSSQACIAGIPISLASHRDVVEDIAERIQRRERGGVISITNTESMYHALRRPDHMAFIQRAQHSLCDGVGVIAAGWFWGLRIQRYNGPVLQLNCSEHGVSRGWRHFYYGGKEGVAELMAQKLQERFPGLVCVGTYCPPFRELTPEEDEEIVQRINEARPDFVWVGVGAAFDYHSGAVPWAAAPLRALGLEWVFRLIIQPRLRARRYWWSLVFVVEAAVKGLFARVGSSPSSS